MTDLPGGEGATSDHGVPTEQAAEGTAGGRSDPAGTSERGRPARLPVIAGLVALLAAGGLADRAGTTEVAGGAAPPLPQQPVAAPAAALSSSWFCAGANGSTGMPASGEVIIANNADDSLAGTVRLVPSSGAAVDRAIAVPGHSSYTVAEALPGKPAWVAAIVDLAGGSAAVVERVAGPTGAAVTPCATSGSASWYLPTGETLVNATETVSLLNPYPTDAVVDLTFTTDQGLEAPGDYQGVVVPAGQLVTLNLGDHLRRRRSIATTLHARSGRVVAWETEVVSRPASGEAVIGGTPDPSNPTSADPADPAYGVTLTLGAPSSGATWVWPDGLSGDGTNEQYVIYNPSSSRTAEVALSIDLDAGQAEPFDLTVPPQAVTTIVAASQARIPAGVGHAALLRSINGVGVVAARQVAAVAPASRLGAGVLLGIRMAATTWLVPYGAQEGADATLEVLAPGENPLDVTVSGWDHGQTVPLNGLTDLTVPPGRRMVLPLAAATKGYSGPLVVQASGPVYVESDITGGQGRPGLSLSSGVPLS